MEPNRPLFHFTPPMNWMNDPNGLVYFDGEYHLYYQHNPYGKEWDHMSWGHAVSPDLIRWQHLPIAILEEPKQGYTIFSGSAVVDWHNTSGFGRPGQPPIVAIYTADHHPATALEDIRIACSLDRGRSFTQFGGNPVLDTRNSKYGDPKVFWHAPSGRWILVAIHGDAQGWVDLYGSADLKRWELLSQFRAEQDAPGIWECPDLFPVPVEAPEGAPDGATRWVLKVNAVTPNHGPAVTRYFVGEFDGVRFTADPPRAQIANPDLDAIYAQVTYNDVPAADGRRILIGWVRQTARQDRAWTGMQSIPRVLTLRPVDGGLRLCQEPVAELARLRGRSHHAGPMPVSEGAPILAPADMGRGAGEIEVEFEPPPQGECGIRLRWPHHAATDIGYSAATNELFVDQHGRPRLGIPLPHANGRVALRIFVDRGIVEVFGDRGQATITAMLDTETAPVGMDVFAEGGPARLIRLALWEMEPA